MKRNLRVVPPRPNLQPNRLNLPLFMGSRILVCHIGVRGFENLKPIMPAHEFESIYSRYLRWMFEAIENQGGVASLDDNYSINAIWNFSHDDPDTVQDLIKTCQEIRQVMLDMNGQLAAFNRPLLKMNAGVHIGQTTERKFMGRRQVERVLEVAQQIEFEAYRHQCDLVVSSEVVEQADGNLPATLLPNVTIQVNGSTLCWDAYRIIQPVVGTQAQELEMEAWPEYNFEGLEARESLQPNVVELNPSQNSDLKPE